MVANVALNIDDAWLSLVERCVRDAEVNFIQFHIFGVWLSLVERFVRDEEVAGSNPVTPIFKGFSAD